jgi:hypothetical protein
MIEFLDIAEALKIDRYEFLSKIAEHPPQRRKKKPS